LLFGNALGNILRNSPDRSFLRALPIKRGALPLPVADQSGFDSENDHDDLPELLRYRPTRRNAAPDEVRNVTHLIFTSREPHLVGTFIEIFGIFIIVTGRGAPPIYVRKTRPLGFALFAQRSRPNWSRR
jgi:hypothetical protein